MSTWCLAVTLTTVACGQAFDVVDVQIQPQYRDALRANEFLMQGGGVDVLSRAGEGDVLIGVARVPLKPDATSADAERARRVAEAKATATVGRFLRTDLATVSILVRESAVASENVDGGQQRRVHRIEKFLSTQIRESSQFQGRIERIGQWCSSDRQFVYVAVAVTPVA